MSLSDCLKFLRYWVIYLYYNCLFPRFWHVINFEINLILLSSRFSTWLISQDKTLNILRTKIAFNVKWKAFLIILKDCKSQKIVSDLRLGHEVFRYDIKFKAWNRKMNNKWYRNTKNFNTERRKPSFT